MGFLRAKSDLAFAKKFREAVIELWGFEDEASARLNNRGGRRPILHGDRQRETIALSSQQTGYSEARQSVSQRVIRASRIADRLRVPHRYVSFPAPAIGGPNIELDLFQAILADTSHGGIERHILGDALHQLFGAAQDEFDKQRRNLINPLYWVKELIIAILRIPFMLIEASGFDVGKIEDNLFGKLFKVLEILALIWIGTHILGLTPEDLLKFLNLRNG
jgi:hypothetical protein